MPHPCHTSSPQLLTLTATPLPDVSTTGVPREACPAYASARRPELAAAEAYFAAMGGSSDREDTWDTTAAALFLGLSFVAGGVSVLAGLMVSARLRQQGGGHGGGQDRLLSNSQGQQQKAKSSF